RYLAGEAPARAHVDGRTVVITDAGGRVIAANSPAARAGGPDLVSLLGPAQALTTFAERAGVMQIRRPDGVETLAAVHGLTAPFGQLAIVQPVSEVLRDW